MIASMMSCNLYQYNPYWDKHPAQKRRLVKHLVKHIHDHDDWLHIDLTPSVYKLQVLGLETIEGCMEAMDDKNSLTRLRAETAANGAMALLIERDSVNHKN
jgi:hypothetical protein